MSYKILIVDDEEPARKLLELHASKIKELELVGTCANAIDAKRMLSGNNIDILLSDIQMDDITGLDLLRMLKNKPATILTTAYSEYALEGYELDVVDYLVKPISFERFFKSISKAMDYVKAKKMLDGPTATIRTATENTLKYMFLKVEHKLVKVNFEGILYLESFGEYVKVFTKGKMHLTLRTLTSFEEVLPAANFYRLHRSYIINLDEISVIEENSAKVGEKLIPISRRVKEEFMKALSQRGAF